MVRALKKVQTKLVSDGLLTAELPSYFTECLVYNVDDAFFGHDTYKAAFFGHDTYKADMRAVLASIFNETLTTERGEWEQVHGLTYLFVNEFKKSDAHKMASAAWDAIGFK
jgi:hypothetical protein